jgi:hypothetical protein
MEGNERPADRSRAGPGAREGAAMRLVVRFLLFEVSLAWALILAGVVRAGMQACPFLGRALAACLRAWRLCLGLALGFPVAAGWPLLIWFRHAQPGYRNWLQGIAIPWWIVLGVTALMVLITKVSSEAGLGAGGGAAGGR